MPIFDQREDGLFVLHPLVDWTDEMVEAYAQKNGVHQNFLDYDFLKMNEDLECGIHLSQG